MLRRVLLTAMIAMSMVIGMIGLSILDSENMAPGAFMILTGFSLAYVLIVVDEKGDF